MRTTAVVLGKYLLSSPLCSGMRSQSRPRPRGARPRIRLRSVLLAALVVASVGVAAVSAPVGAQSGPDASPTCSFPVSETDATDTTVTVTERPERIVVLQPSTAQTVWELGAADRVVGAPVGPYTEYLAGIGTREDVTNADEFSVNREAVVALEADVVLAANVVPDDTVSGLRAADQTVFVFGFGTSLSSVAEKTELTGRLIGSCGAATDANAQYRDRIEAVENATEGRESPRVLHYSGGPAGHVVAGSGTFIDEIITTAGGTNVAAENGIEGYGQISDEAVVEWDPEVILVSEDGSGVPDSEAFASTFAVRNDQVVAVDGNYLSQPGPRVVIAIEELAAALEAAETEGGDTAAGSESDPEDAPGFGAAAALIALAAGVLLAERRR